MNLKARSGGGDLTISLPAVVDGCNVKASASGGDNNVEVDLLKASKRIIDANSDGGDLTIKEQS